MRMAYFVHTGGEWQLYYGFFFAIPLSCHAWSVFSFGAAEVQELSVRCERQAAARMNSWMSGWMRSEALKCKTKFVLTLKQAARAPGLPRQPVACVMDGQVGVESTGVCGPVRTEAGDWHAAHAARRRCSSIGLRGWRWTQLDAVFRRRAVPQLERRQGFGKIQPSENLHLGGRSQICSSFSWCWVYGWVFCKFDTRQGCGLTFTCACQAAKS